VLTAQITKNKVVLTVQITKNVCWQCKLPKMK
jgi:hypothetical protein